MWVKGCLRVCDNKSGRKETLTPSLLSLFFSSPPPNFSDSPHSPPQVLFEVLPLALPLALPRRHQETWTATCGSPLLATNRQSSLGAGALVGTLRAGDLAAVSRAGTSQGGGAEQSLGCLASEKGASEETIPSLDPRKEGDGAPKGPFSRSHQPLLQRLQSERQ